MSEAVTRSILSDIISAAVDTSHYILDISQLTFPAQSGEDVTIHPLHSHLLLYTRHIDTGASLHIFKCLQHLVEAQPPPQCPADTTPGTAQTGGLRERFLLCSAGRRL